MFIFPAGTSCLFLRKKQTGFQLLDWSSETFCPKQEEKRERFPIDCFPQEGWQGLWKSTSCQ